MNLRIDYVELPARDLAEAKRFYAAAFEWTFEDYGPDYVAFSNSGLEGGFRRSGTIPARGGSMVILYADDLAAAEASVVAVGGKILERHEFPGGRRFQFTDPTGNELAVWTRT